MTPLRVTSTLHSTPATCRLRRRTNHRLRFIAEHGHDASFGESAPMLAGSPCGTALIGTIANALARSTQLEQGLAVALQFLMDATGSTLAAVDLLRGDALPPLRVEINRGGRKLPHFEGDPQLVLSISRITRAIEFSTKEADLVLGPVASSLPEAENVVVAPVGVDCERDEGVCPHRRQAPRGFGALRDEALGQ